MSYGMEYPSKKETLQERNLIFLGVQFQMDLLLKIHSQLLRALADKN